MKGHAVTVPPTPFRTPSGLGVTALPAATDNLVWALSRGADAWAIDGPSATELLPWLAAGDRALRGVLLTHGHGDHVGVALDLAARGAAAPVFAPAAAEEELGRPPDRAVSGGDLVDLGGIAVEVLATPGHHAWHVSYLVDGVLFCGDTLFAGGCGRAFHDVEALWHSLRRLAGLPPDTVVCCAHEYTLDNLRFAAWALPGDPAVAARLAHTEAVRARGECTLPTTLGLELATNPFLRAPDLATFRRLRADKDRAAHRT